MHATGDQSLWDLHDLPVPTRTMDFYELPTDTPIVVQNQQWLAKVGNEIVRVKNHPEDHVPTVMERFEALALQQQKESGAKPKRQSKDRNTEERSITPRRSSRNKKPTLASKDLLYTNASEAKTILNSTQNNYADFLHIFFRVLTTIRFPDFLVYSRLHTTPPSWGLCNQLLWRPSSVSNPAGWRPASPRRLRWLDRRGAQMRLQSVD